MRVSDLRLPDVAEKAGPMSAFTRECPRMNRAAERYLVIL
jgi:hypothetical protein